ncbi:MAG: serine/threonine protein kinase [Deltaproteobacteria bacterium]|nr:serine/threonine protein kinase [Deltaproteobacteria bacterium]
MTTHPPTGCPEDAALDAYVQGDLPTAAREALDHHLATCWDCREVLAELSRAPAPPATPDASDLPNTVHTPQRLAGRFVILELLGRGGMGAVYSAYDAVLDRRVAIKVVALHNRTPDAHRRLKAEATALARVVHPHVVPIHDVIWAEGQLLLVMERVVGHTLDAWQRHHKPDTPVLLETLRQVAQGLGAVHANGLVHGDIKPANILVRANGHACLIDFGLAQEEGSAGAPAAAEKRGGTPAYMAPELWRGERGSACTDQFAFCATALEVLVGVLPRAGMTLQDVPAAQRGRRKVPDALLRTLLRGVSTLPQERLASMSSVAAALSPQASPRLSRALTAVLVVTLLAGVTVGVRAQRHAACEDAAGDLDAVLRGPSWAAARERFVNNGPGPAAVWSAAQEQLRTFALSWEAARARTCDAWAPLPQATDCLQQRTLEVEAFLQVTEPQGLALERGLQPLAHLSDVRACLEQGDWLPADAAAASAVRGVRETLARVDGWLTAGQSHKAFEAAQAAQQRAQQTGYLPLQHEAAELLARTAVAAGKYAEAEVGWWQAAEAAVQMGDDDDAQRAFTQLHWVLGALALKRDAAVPPGRLAQSLASRTTHPQDAELIWRYAAGRVARAQGQWTLAEEHQRRALTLWRAGARASWMGQDDIHNELGVLLLKQGNAQAALDQFEAVAARLSDHLGPHHPLLAVPMINQGLALKRLGRLPEALALMEASRTLTRETVGAAHPRSLTATNNLGDALLVGGRPEDALREFDGCARAAATTLGSDHLITLLCQKGGADALRQLGQTRPAVARYRAVLSRLEAVMGLDNEYTASARCALARALLGQGAAPEALTLAEASLRSREASHAAPTERADSMVVVASALKALRQRPDRVCQLGQEAQSLLANSGAPGQRLAAQAVSLQQGCSGDPP